VIDLRSRCELGSVMCKCVMLSKEMRCVALNLLDEKVTKYFVTTVNKL
jgi:hypothetical protein